MVSEWVVRTFRLPVDLHALLRQAAGRASVQGEVVDRLWASFGVEPVMAVRPIEKYGTPVPGVARVFPGSALLREDDADGVVREPVEWET